MSLKLERSVRHETLMSALACAIREELRLNDNHQYCVNNGRTANGHELQLVREEVSKRKTAFEIAVRAYNDEWACMTEAFCRAVAKEYRLEEELRAKGSKAWYSEAPVDLSEVRHKLRMLMRDMCGS